MQEFLPYITSIGFLALGAGIIFVQYRIGSNTGIQVSSQVIQTYKTQVEQLREELAVERKGRETDRHALKNEIQKLSLQLERIKGAEAEKDKKLKEYMEIFQGRNPEQEASMKYIMEVAQGSAKYMKESSEILKEVKEFMKQLNKHVGTISDRNKRIDAQSNK